MENKNKEIVKKISLQEIENVDYNNTQSNSLVEACYNMTLSEIRVISALIALVGKNDNEFPIFELSTKHLCKLCGIDTSNGYRTLDNVRKSLMEREFFIPTEMQTEDGVEDAIKYYNWISSIECSDNRWRIQLSNALIPHLLNLKKNFTSERLKIIREYETVLSMRLDMIFTMYFGKKTSKMSLTNKKDYTMRLNYPLDVFKRMIGKKDKYNDFRAFSQKILKPAIEDINLKKNYQVSLTYEKNKQKVTNLIFWVTLGENNELRKEINIRLEQAQKDKDYNNWILENKDIVSTLEKLFLFSAKDIVEISVYSREEIINVLKQLKMLIKSNQAPTDKKEYILSKLKGLDNDFWESL